MKRSYFLSIGCEFSEKKVSTLCYMAYQKRQKVSHNSNGYEHRKVELIDKGSCKYKTKGESLIPVDRTTLEEIQFGRKKIC